MEAQVCGFLGWWATGQAASTELNIIIIIVSKTAGFEPRPSASLHLVFTSLDFVTFFYRTSSSALFPTPNLEDQVSVFMTPSDRVAQL
jgi:hypothetical protein